MFDLFPSSQSDAGGRAKKRPAYDITAFADYEDTPYLTGLVNLCTAIGVFVGIMTAIILLGTVQRGFGRYWSLVLILVIDLAVNVAARLIRFRRRQALGWSRSKRRWHVGLEPSSRQHHEPPR